MQLTTINATTIQIGNSEFPFKCLADASRAYSATIEATDATASGRTGPLAPRCVIKENGTAVAHISYNGKIWQGSEKQWDRNTVCLYDPYAMEMFEKTGVTPSTQRRIRRQYEEWVGYDPRYDDPNGWNPIESIETLRGIRELKNAPIPE